MIKLSKHYLFCLLLILPTAINAQNKTVDIAWSYLQSREVTKGMPFVLDLYVASTAPFTKNVILFNIPDSLQQDSAIMHRLDSIYAPILFAERDAYWYESLVFMVESDWGKKKVAFKPVIMKPYPLNEKGLKPGTSLHISYGIDPAITKKWKKGIINIKAGIRMANGTDTLWTTTLMLSTSKRVVKGINDMTEKELYQNGSYWMLRDECQKAKPFAAKIYEADPGKFDHITLLAQVSECMGQPWTALGLYINAYENLIDNQSVHHTEPPVQLMMKIYHLQNELMGIQFEDEDETEESDFEEGE